MKILREIIKIKIEKIAIPWEEILHNMFKKQRTIKIINKCDFLTKTISFSLIIKRNMRGFLLLILAIVFSILIAGCNENSNGGPIVNETKSEAPLNIPSTTLFYYYKPGCHFCELVEPYFDLLSEETDLKIIPCNTDELDKCSEEAVKLMEEEGVSGTPTAILVNNSNSMSFVGWRNIAVKLGPNLEYYKIELPAFECVSGNYSVQDCMNCHVSKGEVPPSEFICEKCPEIN